MTSTTNKLSTPLLSNLPQTERDADDYDEEGCMRGSPKIVAAADDDDESNDDSSQYAWWFDNCAVTVVLPALVFLQFGMSFYTSCVEADTGLQWSTVNCSIVMFVITASLYHKSVRDCNLSRSVASLLPEIIMDIILGLVLFGKIVPAFLVLLSGMLCMAVFVMASDIRVLVVAKASPKEDCAKQLQERFAAVGFEPVQTV